MGVRTTSKALAATILGLCLVVLAFIGYKHWWNANAIIMGKRVFLTRGTDPSGQPWELYAQVERNRYLNGHQQRLCLNLMVGGHQSGGGCEFDSRGSFGFWDLSPGPGRSEFILGPVPPAAVKVRMSFPGSPTQIVPSSPLPALPGIPAGRYFIVDADPTGTITAGSDGQHWWTVTPLDSSGHSVAFTIF